MEMILENPNNIGSSTPSSIRFSKKEIIESPRNKVHNAETKNIGKFVLTGDLGEGTFGKVKIGHHVLSGEKVAIKVLEKKRILEIVDKNRVEREIKLLKMLRHKNIIQLYCVIQTATNIYLIMEYASGNELFNYIVAKKRLSEQESCEFFQQLVSGIEYLHKFKIVHRDIKPENIILDNKKTLKIIDFGLSNSYRKIELLSTQCGSPCYAAPEMISGNKYRGENIDIWSTGITLFAMVCGFLPFEDMNNDALYKKITEGKFTIPQFLSDGVKDLLRHVLTVDPEKRYKIVDIKAHPWFGLVNPPKFFEGLMMNYHIMPIEEKIIEKMIELDFKPEEVRLSILANKHSHISTTYYLLLKREIIKGLESIADLSSSLYKDYINNPKNLLHNYNNDINIIIRERCYKPPNFDEDIRYIPINYNYTGRKSNIIIEGDTTVDLNTNNKKQVSFNNRIEVINANENETYEFLVNPNEGNCSDGTCGNTMCVGSCENKVHHKNAKEKFIKPDKKMMEECCCDINNCSSNNEDNSSNNNTTTVVNTNITNTTTNTTHSISNVNNINNKFNLNLTHNRIFKKKKSPSQIKPKQQVPQRRLEEQQIMQERILISDRNLNVSIKPFLSKEIDDNKLYLLNKVYPKSGSSIPDENTKVRGKPYNFKTNFIDTSMSFEQNVDNTKNTYDSLDMSKSKLDIDYNNSTSNNNRNFIILDRDDLSNNNKKLKSSNDVGRVNSLNGNTSNSNIGFNRTFNNVVDNSSSSNQVKNIKDSNFSFNNANKNATNANTHVSKVIKNTTNHISNSDKKESTSRARLSQDESRIKTSINHYHNNSNNTNNNNKSSTSNNKFNSSNNVYSSIKTKNKDINNTHNIYNHPNIINNSDNKDALSDSESNTESMINTKAGDKSRKRQKTDTVVLVNNKKITFNDNNNTYSNTFGTKLDPTNTNKTNSTSTYCTKNTITSKMNNMKKTINSKPVAFKKQLTKTIMKQKDNLMNIIKLKESNNNTINASSTCHYNTNINDIESKNENNKVIKSNNNSKSKGKSLSSSKLLKLNCDINNNLNNNTKINTINNRLNENKLNNNKANILNNNTTFNNASIIKRNSINTNNTNTNITRNNLIVSHDKISYKGSVSKLKVKSKSSKKLNSKCIFII